MKPTPLSEIAAAMAGRLTGGQGDLTVAGVTIDTRTARAGELFFAIDGENFDGHDFLPQAAAAGCAAAVVRRGLSVPAEVADRFGGGVIVVGDTVQALGRLASDYRGRFAARVVAVTGSNGKTTVKGMIHHILVRTLKGSRSPKSFNNEIGVPLTLLAVEADDEYVVCEVGSNAPGEIAALGRMVQPDIAAITCVSATHLEKLVSLEGVAREKASLLGCVGEGGVAIVWADSDVLARAVADYNVPAIWFGRSQAADPALRLTDYRQEGWGQHLTVGGELTGQLAQPGRHNAMNALAAMAVAEQFGVPRGEALSALGDYRGCEMRLEPIETPGVTIINDAYNANPASVLAAVDILTACQGGRKVVIAGDMCELGEKTRRLHVQTGRKAARRGVDLLIGVGPLGRYIAKGAAEAAAATHVFDSVEDARQHVGEWIQRGDIILVKASRAVELERLIDVLRSCPAARDVAAEAD